MSEPPTDFELLQAWRRGDAPAGQKLFKRHFRAVYRFFQTKCEAEADELVQATFTACVRARDNFRGDSAFTTYLYTVARHELYRVLAERRRDLGRVDFEVSSIAQLAPTPRTQIATREDRACLLRALRDLPVEQQTLLELHYWESVEIGALAEIFDSPASTIRSRLHRARNALRERMQRDAEIPAAATATIESFEAWARSLAQS